MSIVTVAPAGQTVPAVVFKRIDSKDHQVVEMAFGDADTSTLVTTANGLPVAGPITDDELRASPVAVTAQTLATTSRTYGTSVRIVTTSSAAVRSAAITATEVTLSATVDGFFAIGNSSVDAADANGSFPIGAFATFTRQITSGQYISFIRAGSTDGALFILPVA